MKRAIVIVLAFLVGGYVGYILGVRYTLTKTVPIMNSLKFSHFFKVLEDASEAYYTADSKVAVWALERLAEHLEAYEIDEFGRIFKPSEKTIEFDVILTYARLAKLVHKENEAQSKFYMGKALEIGSRRFTNETLTEERIFEIIGQVDSNAVESIP